MESLNMLPSELDLAADRELQ